MDSLLRTTPEEVQSAKEDILLLNEVKRNATSKASPGGGPGGLPGPLRFVVGMYRKKDQINRTLDN